MPVSASISSIEFRIIYFYFVWVLQALFVLAPVSSSTSSPVPIVIASMFSLQELEENSGWCFFWQCASYSSEHRRNGVYVYDILCQDVTLEFGICIEWQRFTPLTSVSLFSRQAGRECDVKKHKRHKFISPLSGHFPPTRCSCILWKRCLFCGYSQLQLLSKPQFVSPTPPVIRRWTNRRKPPVQNSLTFYYYYCHNFYGVWNNLKWFLILRCEIQEGGSRSYRFHYNWILRLMNI